MVNRGGSGRDTHFDVNESDESEFENSFRQEYGDAFYLFNREDVGRLELFGPCKPSPTCRATDRQLCGGIEGASGVMALGEETRSDWAFRYSFGPEYIGDAGAVGGRLRQLVMETSKAVNCLSAGWLRSDTFDLSIQRIGAQTDCVSSLRSQSDRPRSR